MRPPKFNISRISCIHPAFRSAGLAVTFWLATNAAMAGPVPPLVPMKVAFSTYLGGSLFEHARDVAVDSKGNFYVVGGSESPDLTGITTSLVNGGSRESSSVRNLDIFVYKFGPAGKLIWGTRIGGPNYDRAYAVEVDSEGYVYVGGRVGNGFPVTSGAAQVTFRGGAEASFYGNQDGGVFKLTPDGKKIVWSTFFGANDAWIVRDIDLDANGNVYLVSGHSVGTTYTSAVQAAFAGSFQPNVAGTKDTVVAKIAANGSKVLWATHLGGSLDESQAPALRVHKGTGAVYILTTTKSSNIPTSATAYDRTFNGVQDLYVAKLNASGTQLLFGTYLGGSANEGHETHQIALDEQGNVYVVTGTSSTNYPTTTGVFQKFLKGTADIALSKLSADGSKLMASTLIGGSGGEFPQGISVNASGEAIFTGTAGSTDFPVTANALRTTHPGTGAAIIVQVAADMKTLRFSTYFGGAGGDNQLRASAIDSSGNIYAVGETGSPNWPLKKAIQTIFGGPVDGNDAVAVKISPVAP